MKEYQRSERESRNRVAEQYDHWYTETKGRWFNRREQEVFSLAVCPDSVVLDLGSGTGRISALLARRAAFTVACDFSLNSLSYLQSKRIPRVAAVGADAVTGLPFRTGTFDAVLSCQVIQHLMPDDLAAALRECHRVLKVGGRFYFAVYNLDYWRFRRVSEKVDESGLYYRRFNPPYIHDLATKARFSVKHIGYYKMLPSRVPGAQSLSDDLLIRTDRFLCGIPLFRRFASVYLFAELEAQRRLM